MFDDYMNHTCNIYHLAEEDVNAGYGIHASCVKNPNKEPDEIAVPCHFHISTNGQVHIVQKEPFSAADGETKLSLPIGTDIRRNDIVQDCRDGMKYRADIPKEIHGGHHIIVMLSPLEGTRGAI